MPPADAAGLGKLLSYMPLVQATQRQLNEQLESIRKEVNQNLGESIADNIDKEVILSAVEDYSQQLRALELKVNPVWP